MLLSAHLIALMESYAATEGVPLSTASKRSSGTATTIARLQAGGSITDRRYAQIAQWFADNWPAGHPWPRGFARPARSPAGVAA